MTAFVAAWALADAALSKFMPLWFSARGTEFTWANAQMGIDANIRLLSFLAFTTLVWVWSFARRTHPLTHVGLGVVLLIPAAKGCVEVASCAAACFVPALGPDVGSTMGLLWLGCAGMRCRAWAWTHGEVWPCSWD